MVRCYVKKRIGVAPSDSRYLMAMGIDFGNKIYQKSSKAIVKGRCNHAETGFQAVLNRLLTKIDGLKRDFFYEAV